MSEVCETLNTPTAGSSYYELQAEARGINDVSDVERLAQDSTKIYSQVLAPWLPNDKNAGIYEVACGPGILQSWLKSEGYTEVYGSDFAETEAQLAQVINPNIRHGDSVAGVISRGEGKYRAIVALDFIEHIPRDLVIPFLENCMRALEPGGVLIMRAPNADSPVVGLNLFNDMTHVWAYTTISMRAMLKIIGYRSIEFQDDTLSSIQKYRWIKYPIMVCAQLLLKGLLTAACRFRCEYLGSSIYMYARK